MKDIEEIITEVLTNATNLPVYYIEAIEQTGDYIVYNYLETPMCYSNNNEEITKFDIIINLYYRGDFSEVKKKIMTALKEKGFVKQPFGIATYDNRAHKYNMPMQYEYFLENK